MIHIVETTAAVLSVLITEPGGDSYLILNPAEIAARLNELAQAAC